MPHSRGAAAALLAVALSWSSRAPACAALVAPAARATRPVRFPVAMSLRPVAAPLGRPAPAAPRLGALAAVASLRLSPAAAPAAAAADPALPELPAARPLAAQRAGRPAPARAARPDPRAALSGLSRELRGAAPGGMSGTFAALSRFWTGRGRAPVAAAADGGAVPRGRLAARGFPEAAGESFGAAPRDPFEPVAAMPAGRWIKGRDFGRRIDASRRRPLTILTPAQAAPYAPKEGELVAANFSHAGRFWIAKIPLDAVARVIFQKWDFGEKRVRLRLFGRTLLDFPVFRVAHTELRFALRPGRELALYPQGRLAQDAAPPVPGERIADVVSSVEGVGVPGAGFGVLAGLTNRLVAVRRFKSLRESYEERVVKSGLVIQQWDLVMSDAQKQEIFRRAIALSDREGMRELYHLFGNSCTTASFGLLDSAMNFGAREWRTLLKRVPLFPEAYLWIRGLLRPRGESRLPTVNEELA